MIDPEDSEKFANQVVALASGINVLAENQPVDVVIAALTYLLTTGIENNIPEERRQRTRMECIMCLLEDAQTDEEIKLS